MVKCSIKGCNKQAKVFLKTLRFCDEHAKEIGIVQDQPAVYVFPKDTDMKVTT